MSVTEDSANFVDNYSHEDVRVFYTDTNIPGPGVDPTMLQTSLCVQCSCQGICAQDCACVLFSGQSFNYINNLLNVNKLSSNSFILECNELCKCSQSCGNRMVQFGPKNHLSVFKTDSKGYGLRTELFISKGSFICEYAGELIGKEEAKRRAKHDSINYIFVLKEHYAGSVTETIIDPTCIGNIGRYINHSCQPNAAIIPVRIDSPIPRLAVFSIKDIQINEEITYDYASGGGGTGKTRCFCNSVDCCGFLPFDEELLS